MGVGEEVGFIEEVEVLTILRQSRFCFPERTGRTHDLPQQLYDSAAAHTPEAGQLGLFPTGKQALGKAWKAKTEV